MHRLQGGLFRSPFFVVLKIGAPAHTEAFVSELCALYIINITSQTSKVMAMNAFQKTAITTLIAVLVLIGVGSLVRVSGAGLGCPDWPRCWGSWLPPSGPDAIDPAYLEARGLSMADFNPVKMWIEYINRLIGVTIGLLIIATFLRSFPYRTTQPEIFWGSFASLALVIFQGWLGGQVVRSGLQPGIITLHMILAVILLCLLLYVTFQAFSTAIAVQIDPAVRRRLALTTGLLFGVICLQTFLGTQVREAIDPYIKDAGGLSRSVWMENVGWIDHLHRSFTWLVIAATAFLIHTVRAHRISGLPRTLAYASTAIILAQTAFGITLAYGGLPHLFQVLHLVTASALICAVYALLLSLRRSAHSATAM